MKSQTNHTLRKSAEHIYYETWMFYITLVQLTKPRSQIEVNILLDDFAIHTRNLFEFFYPPKKKKYPDDMSVYDYIGYSKVYASKKTKKKELLFVKRKTDRQVVHLTYKRNHYNKNTKMWPFTNIGKKVYKTVDAFYESLSTNQKKWLHFVELKKVIESNRQFFG